MRAKWYINDLSLQRQQAHIEALISELEELLKFRHRNPSFRDRLLCTGSLADCSVTHDRTFREVIASNRSLSGQVLRWMGNGGGPFWDDERAKNKDDYFQYGIHDVTEQGLGEAARRRLLGQDARSFSFPGGQCSFTYSPLTVQQGLSEEPLEQIPVPNLWTVASLDQEQATETALPKSWSTLLPYFRQKFSHIIFSDTVMDELKPCPYQHSSANEIGVLLDVLNRLCAESPSGQLTSSGLELYKNYFNGENAKFTDESPTNQRDFKKEMIFFDPTDPSQHLFCSWHGKVNHAVTPLRIHFQWPRPPGEQHIKVVYIGPKITRR
ncbi:MAG: hypothetical protein HQL80_05065 [Magnetococcales bacterium]|nr:hypothetical protein [Magnetococcales bacterium]